MPPAYSQTSPSTNYSHLYLLAMRLLLWAVSAGAAHASAVYAPFDDSRLSANSFFDQFNAQSLEDSGWIPSHAHKSDGSEYSGTWSLEQATKYPGFAGDHGLVMKSEAALYAISKKLPTVFTNEDKPLVLQFEVKYQDQITCAGSYIKLLAAPSGPNQFSDVSPFEIMFGPDICGSDNKVAFVVKKHVVNSTVESTLRTPPMARANFITNLYTLVVYPNNDMEIRINGEVAKAGNMINTPHFMVPPLSIPEYIPDPDASRPDDWDDRRYIFDRNVEKPADWDAKHGLKWIPNPEVPKPSGWNDDETQQEFIRDPQAQKPAEWDDEEDGAWNAPLIRNPQCLYGCGRWEAPKIVNADYKGEWVPPAIENPAYQGEWKPPMKKNPNYSSKVQAHILPVDAIGIEVWSMQSGIMFNNVYLGNSVSEAELIGNATYAPKVKLEYADYEINKPTPKHRPRAPPRLFEDMLDDDSVLQFQQFVAFLRELFLGSFYSAQDMWYDFQRAPIPFITAHPVRFGLACVGFLFVFTFVFGAINVLVFVFLSSPAEVSEPERPKIEELTEEEMIAEITGKSSGAQTGSTSPKKRK